MSSTSSIFYSDVYGGTGDGPYPKYRTVVEQRVDNEKIGAVTPNYRLIIRRGGRPPPLPYKRSNTFYKLGSGSFIEESTYLSRGTKTRVWTLDGTIHPYELGMSVSPSGIRSWDWNDPQRLSIMNRQLNLKLLMKIKDQKVNLSQMFAERKQVVTMIGDTATKVAKMIVSLRRGNLKEAASVLGLQISDRKDSKYRRRMQTARVNSGRDDLSMVLSSGVLQLQYGWRPLLSDIYGSAEVLANAASPLVSSRVKVVTTHSTSSDETLNPRQAEFQHIASWANVRIELGLEFQPSFSMGHQVSQLGLSNPALIAWELMPWSFVVDWFIPIGNFISSWDATLGLSFLSGYRSTKISAGSAVKLLWTGEYARQWGYMFSQTGSASYTWRTESFERVVLTDFPSVSAPTFKNPLSLDHAINAFALLRQAIGVKTRG